MTTVSVATTVTIGGDLTVGRIGYRAMQLTGPKAWGEYPDHIAWQLHRSATALLNPGTTRPGTSRKTSRLRTSR